MFKSGDIVIVDLPTGVTQIPVFPHWASPNLGVPCGWTDNGSIHIITDTTTQSEPAARLHNVGWILQRYLIKMCKDAEGGIYFIHGRQRQPKDT